MRRLQLLVSNHSGSAAGPLALQHAVARVRSAYRLSDGNRKDRTADLTDKHSLTWRRAWDSNPRMLSHHQFSRLAPSAARTALHDYKP